MQYCFDKIIDRRSTNSLKWSVKKEELPMWVADMDFETAPEIKEELLKRAEHGVFGYADITGEWYEAYIGWWKRRHHFEIHKDWLIYSAGVVPTMSSVVRKLTTAAENVVILTPVYNIFYNSILNNGRNVLECELLYDGDEYHINFNELESHLSNPQTTLLIFCNPHNPVGKIWDKETLLKVGELCLQYHVTILSDEIHCDLTEPECEYIPFATVSEEISNIIITCIAPTKTFNIAGLQTSAVVVKNPFLRHKVWRGLNTDEVGEPNAFAVTAAVAAFTRGELWLEELRKYIFENKKVVKDFVEQEIGEVKVVASQATYLMWLDCREVFLNKRKHSEKDASENSEKLAGFIREKTGLYLSDGVQYGKGGEQFLRLNVACPRETLLEGLQRLKRGVDSYKDS